ncbi:MAG: DUF1571 domain-containing protein [Pirellulaceae bacterium]|nr:DUF1571 domain-containing protein [Pirellulaceae bacterium]
MSFASLARREFLRFVAMSGGAIAAAPLFGDEPAAFKEPVFRVAKGEQNTAAPADSHPLDPALVVAREALVNSQRNVADYTATIIKRERIKGVLGDYEYMFAKIRNRKMDGDKIVIPLSVYLKFLKPKSIEGREVVWVEGQNNGKLRAHEGGLSGRFLPSVWLEPTSTLAMRGQLHPITDIGIENLIVKLIDRGESERKHGECTVEFIKGAKLQGRLCTVLTVCHPVQRPHFEFYKAQIFIDDEMQLPVRYSAHHWPTDPKDTTGPVLEEYTYIDVKLNQGLKDADFDSENPNYGF